MTINTSKKTTKKKSDGIANKTAKRSFTKETSKTSPEKSSKTAKPIVHSTEKLCAYLGFAQKAGKVVSGQNTCRVKLLRGEIVLLIIGSDAAENSVEKFEFLAKESGTEYRVFGEADMLAQATGQPGKNMFGITDMNFAKIILDQIDHLSDASFDTTVEQGGSNDRNQ